MDERALKVYVYYCTNSGKGNELADRLSVACGGGINPVSVPCSGKIDIPFLVKAFETGADAAVVVTCAKGTCTYLEGNYRAQKRIEAVDSLLQEIGVGAGRLTVLALAEDGIEQTVTSVKDFLAGIKPCSQTTSNSTSRVI